MRCHTELMNALSQSNCLHEPGQPISITRGDRSQLANQFLQGLTAFGASSSCITEASSFVCLFAYGLCSSTGVYIQPTSSQCEELRDSLCSSEWVAAINFGIDLPDCNDFPSTLDYCSQSEEMNDTTLINTTETSEDGMTIVVGSLLSLVLVSFFSS